ncbi:MAG: hypothetical protein GQ527_10655 [Bacteroidales bacterium]|nr:hypothetical protein [Bacteroidales bacterium]
MIRKFFKTNKLVDLKQLIERSINESDSREILWTTIVNHMKFELVLEIGVLRGEFSAFLLRTCPAIKKYHMIDPWQNLNDWNKPSNFNTETFHVIYNEMLSNTEFARNKRIVHRGKTVEVIDKIKNKSLDFIYIDGDHTLKGITTDLIKSWEKVKPGGIIAGDDFTPNIWQHPQHFEPTLVFPFAVYFAEAVGAEIYALPYNQFLIHKSKAKFAFVDLTEKYSELALRNQFIS